ncbi:hemolysin family protein [Gayadomonas joobiniege]|uniref:hemolysin family protein n=1 Tax=Gayadomonas joobiniege TaxID=1234606 RepID=UPI00037D0BC1|nr:hemolysin family protein [Gayadomonas joobiniege]
MDLVWVVLLIGFSAVFALCEISLAAARKVKLQSLVELGDLRAVKVLNLQASAHQFFAAVQVVLNALAIVAGMVGESAFTPYIFQFLSWIITGISHDIQEYTVLLAQIASVCSFLLITGLFVLFADLLPKRIAMVIPETVAIRFIHIMLASVWLFKPVIWFFNLSADLIIKLFHLPTQRDEQVTRNDVAAVIEQSAEQGELCQQEQHLIGNILDLNQTCITQVMHNRDTLICLNSQQTQADQTELIQNSQASLFLLDDGSLDKVTAYVETKQLLDNLLAGRPLLDQSSAPFKSPLVLLETMTVADAFTMLKTKNVQCALVINEFSTVLGMVTLEQILNLIALKDSQGIEQMFAQKDVYHWFVQGDMALKDFQQTVIKYEFESVEAIETLAGFVIHHFKHFPHRGDTLEIEGFKFVVRSVEGFSIKEIEVIGKSER